MSKRIEKYFEQESDANNKYIYNKNKKMDWKILEEVWLLLKRRQILCSFPTLRNKVFLGKLSLNLIWKVTEMRQMNLNDLNVHVCNAPEMSVLKYIFLFAVHFNRIR